MNATAPALGEVIQRVGAVAMVCGLSETKVAALGAAFLSAGASPEVAATALKSFTTTLVKGTAMSKDQAPPLRPSACPPRNWQRTCRPMRRERFSRSLKP